MLELEELARMAGISVSSLIRTALLPGIKVEKEKVKKISKDTKAQYRAFDKWIAGAVHGPGNSEYDKYAYDL